MALEFKLFRYSTLGDSDRLRMPVGVCRPVSVGRSPRPQGCCVSICALGVFGASCSSLTVVASNDRRRASSTPCGDLHQAPNRGPRRPPATPLRRGPDPRTSPFSPPRRRRRPPAPGTGTPGSGPSAGRPPPPSPTPAATPAPRTCSRRRWCPGAAPRRERPDHRQPGDGQEHRDDVGALDDRRDVERVGVHEPRVVRHPRYRRVVAGALD